MAVWQSQGPAPQNAKNKSECIKFLFLLFVIPARTGLRDAVIMNSYMYLVQVAPRYMY